MLGPGSLESAPYPGLTFLVSISHVFAPKGAALFVCLRLRLILSDAFGTAIGARRAAGNRSQFSVAWTCCP